MGRTAGGNGRCSGPVHGTMRKYVDVPELTQTIVNEYIKKIVVYAPDKSSGHRMQGLKIYFNFLNKTEMPLVSELIICKRTYKIQKTA